MGKFNSIPSLVPGVPNQNPHYLIPHRKCNLMIPLTILLEPQYPQTATFSLPHHPPHIKTILIHTHFAYHTVWITGQRNCEDFEFWAEWPQPNVSCTIMPSLTQLELHHSAKCWPPNQTTLSARHRSRLSKRVMPPPLFLAGWPSLCSLVLLLLAPRCLLLMQPMEKLVFYPFLLLSLLSYYYVSRILFIQGRKENELSFLELKLSYL